jgi:hypothetical protein
VLIREQARKGTVEVPTRHHFGVPRDERAGWHDRLNTSPSYRALDPQNREPGARNPIFHSGIPMAEKNELDGLSLPELQKRLADVNLAIEDRKVEELKVIADGYAKKCQMNGFTIKEAIEALKPYLPRRRTRQG